MQTHLFTYGTRYFPVHENFIPHLYDYEFMLFNILFKYLFIIIFFTSLCCIIKKNLLVYKLRYTFY